MAMAGARDGDSEKGPRLLETAAPAHNFTIATEERVRAIANGPPAYVRRKRAIEDLEEGLLRVLVEHC